MILILNAIIIKIFLNYDQLVEYISKKDIISFNGINVNSHYIKLLLPSKTELHLYNNFFGWYHVKEISHVIYYINHFIFLSIILMILIITRKHIKKILKKLIDWSLINSYKRERKIIFYSLIFLIFIIITKSHTGLFFGGISGWDNYNIKPAINKEIDLKSEDIFIRNYYKKTIIEDNTIYIKDDGYISGLGYFMHFDNGNILPFNMGIFNGVFPEIYYPLSSPNYIDQKLACQIIDHLKYSLSKYKKSLIPYRLKYPNHTPYRQINYEKYPDSKYLDSISVHEIYVKISKFNLKIIGGKLIDSYKCLNIN